jgi:hypothetical protein
MPLMPLHTAAVHELCTVKRVGRREEEITEGKGDKEARRVLNLNYWNGREQQF